MEMRFVIRKERNLVIKQFRGDFTVQFWAAAIEKTWKHPDYSHALDAVIDLRGINLMMEVDEIKQIAESLADNSERSTSGRVALLMDSPKVAAFAQILDGMRTDDATLLMHTSEGWASERLGIPFNVEEDLKSPETVEVSLALVQSELNA